MWESPRLDVGESLTWCGRVLGLVWEGHRLVWEGPWLGVGESLAWCGRS